MREIQYLLSILPPLSRVTTLPLFLWRFSSISDLTLIFTKILINYQSSQILSCCLFLSCEALGSLLHSFLSSFWDIPLTHSNPNSEMSVLLILISTLGYPFHSFLSQLWNILLNHCYNNTGISFSLIPIFTLIIITNRLLAVVYFLALGLAVSERLC